jgi:hypothetical protein
MMFCVGVFVGALGTVLVIAFRAVCGSAPGDPHCEDESPMERDARWKQAHREEA